MELALHAIRLIDKRQKNNDQIQDMTERDEQLLVNERVGSQ